MSYFLYINNEVRGPYSENELRDMLAHREIQPDVLASKGSDSEWISLDVSLGLTPQQLSIKSGASLRIPHQISFADPSRVSSPESKIQRSDKGSYQLSLGDESKPEFRTRLWQVAAGLVIAYALLIVLAAIFYRWWNGNWDDPRAMVRLVGRSIACFSVAQGLIYSKGWAFWIAACFSCILTLIGLMGFIVSMETNVFFKRPYPYVDMGIYLLTLSVTFALFVVLIILPLRKSK